MANLIKVTADFIVEENEEYEQLRMDLLQLGARSITEIEDYD